MAGRGGCNASRSAAPECDHQPLGNEELSDAHAVPELSSDGRAHYLDRHPREQGNALKGNDGLAGADATTFFLRDLRKLGVPLLTREEEVALARRARVGDERALEKLVSANLRLCAYLAKRSKAKGRAKGLAFGDLVNAGVIGLRDAIKHFDPERGVRLAALAYIYILGAIRDEMERAQTIRLPREVASLSQKIIKAKERLRAHDYRLTSKGQRVWRGWAPTPEEIATHLGVSPETVAETLRHPSQRIQPNSGPNSPKAGEEAGLGRTRFDDDNSAEAWDVRQVGHNYRADAEGPRDWGVESDQEAHLEASEASALLDKALDTLTKQEREIVSRYFDLVENPEVDEGESLAAIARRLGISRQRASKLKRRALVKLRQALQSARASGDLEAPLDV
jgi:RNA polymerase primary sigma factor